MLESGVKYSHKHRSPIPLMYAYYGTEYPSKNLARKTARKFFLFYDFVNSRNILGKTFLFYLPPGGLDLTKYEKKESASVVNRTDIHFLIYISFHQALYLNNVRRLRPLS